MYDLLSCARTRLSTMIRGERGATAVDVGLLVAVIAVVSALAISSLSGGITGMFEHAASTLAP
jgi:Flp pilus assembly pilin Flp